MSRNSYDALCKKCLLPIRILTGNPMICGECAEKSKPQSEPQPD